MVSTSTFVSASISKNVYLVIVYMCAKFGAFIKKCTIFLLSRYTNTHNYPCKTSFKVYILTVGQYWLGIAKPRNVF